MAVSYTLMPVGRQTFFDANGDPLPGAKLYFTASGTSTPLDTYSDSTGTLNANPVICDSAGRATVYLQAAAYKLVVKNSADVTQYTVDPVAAVNVAQASGADSIGGRLTLESGVAVSTTDQSAKTTLYLTPYKTNVISLYDGSQWSDTSFTEVSASLAGLTASRPYDVFAYLSSGNLTLDLTAWTSATVRATALATQDGRLVKSGATTRRYLGTIYINSTGGQTDDSLTKRSVWNYANRVRRPLLKQPGSNWTYSTATIRQANGSTANQVEVMVGVAEVTLDVQLMMLAANSTGGITVVVGIGEDSTTAMSAEAVGAGYTRLATAAVIYPAGPVRLTKIPAIGRHVYAQLEYSEAVATTTFYSSDPASTSAAKGGLIGAIEG